MTFPPVKPPSTISMNRTLGGKYGAHGATVDAGQEKYLVRYRLDRMEKLRREDVALLGPDGNEEPIGTAEFPPVFQECMNIAMFERKVLFESRLDAKL